MYFKKFAALAVAVVAAVSSMVSTANAAYFTSNGIVEISSLSTPAPLSNIVSFSGPSNLGTVYTNQIDGTATLNGAVRSVSAQIINAAALGNQQILHFGSLASNPLLGLAAVSAVSGSLDSNDIASFDSGTLFLLQVDLNTFDAQDPSTWGGTVLGTYVLETPTSVLPGGLAGIAPAGAVVPQAADDINISTISNIPGSPISQFLFRESPTSNFIHDVEAPVGAPGIREGLLSQVTQIVDPFFIGQASTSDPSFALDDVDLASLNFWAGAAGLSNLSGAGTAFATGFGGAGGTSSDFYADPAGLSSNTGTGDFVAALGSTTYVVASVVPEPSSIALLGLGLVGLGAFGLRNRKNAK